MCIRDSYSWFAQSVPEGQYSASQGVSLNPSVESALSRGEVVRASAWMTGDIDANPEDPGYETDEDLDYQTPYSLTPMTGLVLSGFNDTVAGATVARSADLYGQPSLATSAHTTFNSNAKVFVPGRLEHVSQPVST